MSLSPYPLLDRPLQRLRRRKRARIEIIPMIDTIFFLLVFFMIFSLSLTRQAGIGVEPPQGGAPLRQSAQVVIVIPSERAVMLDGESVAEESLPARLKQSLAAHPDSVAVVIADKEVSHGRVVQIMEVARMAGAKRFAIGTTGKSGGR